MSNRLFKAIAILQIVAVVLAVEVRRDDQWPPKQMIEWFMPAGKLCKEKTGVTEGKFKQIF